MVENTPDVAVPENSRSAVNLVTKYIVFFANFMFVVSMSNSVVYLRCATGDAKVLIYHVSATTFLSNICCWPRVSAQTPYICVAGVLLLLKLMSAYPHILY